MGIRYDSLDETVRLAMLEELEMDLSDGALYMSKLFNDVGRNLWGEILREAIQNHDDNWLASRIRNEGCLVSRNERRTPSGGMTTYKVPYEAADTLAEGEFNRFYLRGLCLSEERANRTHVEVYRGKDVQVPRRDSEALIGTLFNVQNLLNDLRRAVGVDPAFGLPNGPNSGLTARRVP